MDFNSLQYFVLVAKYENMSRAAEILHITQPALSKSISLLEESLGVTLFERNGRSIKLNRYGQFFLERSENLLKDYEMAKEDLLNLVSPGQGVVSIGFMHTLGLEVIPQLMARVQKDYPQLKIQLTQSNSSTILQKLEVGELDLCLISSLDTHKDLVWEKLWEEELFLIVPKSHPLASANEVSLKDFAGEPFISIKQGNTLRKSVDDLYKQEGYQLNVAFEGEEVHTITGLVESGLGVSLIPYIKGLEQYQIQLLKVNAPNCRREIGLAYINKHFKSAATKLLEDYIRTFFQTTKLGKRD
ncbi:LysR family transcriptional regulator [Ureibacillus chungkukjangi]|uniref:DNA-binding transcriptional LysR family regulator n=1 Tax=Ureibacillus chungkukjangi TaxID=1202712 RepID=A0A318TFS1_9BACL|nr:LysR family transcriptional regulator [Ureibacillus chungkukjangi]MCM3389946.1 LysR family transcriptional regulator [Ureibacillus chungkukjangi]PYF03504.1 DNA-binding transcriptional LysR family regulator [Ureibacillus chungkukjangi]